MEVVGSVEAPGHLEGGDFFPAGTDLCLVGIGLRSNLEACKQLMEKDLVGTRRLAGPGQPIRACVLPSSQGGFLGSPEPGRRGCNQAATEELRPRGSRP